MNDMQKSTLFIDESGKSSLLSNEQEPFIITGVILDDQEIVTVEGFFTYIKRKYNIDETKPFHSYHIFENEEIKLPDSQLLELSKTLAEFLSLIPIQITVLEVDKRIFKKAIGLENKEQCKGSKKRKAIPKLPYQLTASKLFKWFAKTLKSEGRIGQVVVDSSRRYNTSILKTWNLCQEGHLPTTKGVVSELINHHVTALCFAEKKFLSGGLEITDLISYITFFRVRELLSKNKDIGIPLIWEKIKERKVLKLIEEKEIKEFFGIKKDEVHKDLK
jgi:hypothetical protein